MVSEARDKPLFSLGEIVATRNAADSLNQIDITAALRRHLQGDWGLVDSEDRQENDRSVTEGFRLLSVYESTDCIRFWIITEADRSVTTVLLPEDY